MILYQGAHQWKKGLETTTDLPKNRIFCPTRRLEYPRLQLRISFLTVVSRKQKVIWVKKSRRSSWRTSRDSEMTVEDHPHLREPGKKAATVTQK